MTGATSESGSTSNLEADVLTTDHESIISEPSTLQESGRLGLDHSVSLNDLDW